MTMNAHVQPQVAIRYAPRGPGLTAALFYVVVGRHVYGWYTGAIGQTFGGAFFALDGFYSDGVTRFMRSVEDDVHGAWVEDVLPEPVDTRSPVPEELAHDLARMQSAFVDEWLFAPEDARAAPEIAAYDRLELPVRELNVQSRHFERFDRSQPVWRFALPGTDLNLVDYLAQCWTLDDRCDTVPVF